MEHCPPEIKEAWTQELEDRGIEVGEKESKLPESGACRSGSRSPEIRHELRKVCRKEDD